LKRVHRVFSFSNVVAVLALFLALGGSVYAASSNKINGSKIKPRSIPGNRIKANSLTAAQIKSRTLTGAKVKPGSLTGKQVVGSTLTGVSASSLAAVNYAVTTVTLAQYKAGEPPRRRAARLVRGSSAAVPCSATTTTRPSTTAGLRHPAVAGRRLPTRAARA
jgi:hypothetical protein